MTDQENRVIRVCRTDELDPGAATRVDVQPPIAVFNIDGDFYATADLCSHDQSSLAEEGYISGGEVECGWHFAKFCVRTGAVTAPPARKPLRSYEVLIEDGYVHVVVPDADATAAVPQESGRK